MAKASYEIELPISSYLSFRGAAPQQEDKLPTLDEIAT
jgi:hypothetical protein